jgi:hypothetical protein
LNESELTRRLCAELKRFNAVTYTISGGSEFMRPGMPDRFLAHRRVCGGAWLEFKASGAKCSTVQREVLREMRERGVNAFVARHGEKSGIEDEHGNLLCTWDGTAKDLLEGLEQLCGCTKVPAGA